MNNKRQELTKKGLWLNTGAIIIVMLLTFAIILGRINHLETQRDDAVKQQEQLEANVTKLNAVVDRVVVIANKIVLTCSDQQVPADLQYICYEASALVKNTSVTEPSVIPTGK